MGNNLALTSQTAIKIFTRDAPTKKDSAITSCPGNAYVKNVDVNQTTKMWVNDVNWKSRSFSNFAGVQSEVEGLLKVVNYEADAKKYKEDMYSRLAVNSIIIKNE